MTNETRSIEAADIVDFCFKIQQGFLDGYMLSDSSDLAPQNIGWVYVATMVKAEDVPVSSISVLVNVDTEQAVAEIAKIVHETVKYDMTPDQQDVAAKIVAGAIIVEPNIVAPKPTQRRVHK